MTDEFYSLVLRYFKHDGPTAKIYRFTRIIMAITIFLGAVVSTHKHFMFVILSICIVTIQHFVYACSGPVSIPLAPEDFFFLGVDIIGVLFIPGTAAMMAGKYWGRFMGANVKVFMYTQRVSPNKTYRGYFAQLTASVIAGYVFAKYLNNLFPHPIPIPFNHIVYLGTALGVAEMSGDLLESFFKRCFGMKDMQNWIPGWGGMLDRLDGYLIMFPMAGMFLYVVEGIWL
jgi:CDP-diglyceride synthetase